MSWTNWITSISAIIKEEWSNFYYSFGRSNWQSLQLKEIELLKLEKQKEVNLEDVEEKGLGVGRDNLDGNNSKG